MDLRFICSSSSSHHELCSQNFRTSAQGYGRGCERSIIRKALVAVIGNQACWTGSVGDSETYRTIRLHASSDADLQMLHRQNIFKMAGTLSLLHILILAQAPLPISPVLLQLVVDGRSSLTIDEGFLQDICPDSLAVFQPFLSHQGLLCDLPMALTQLLAWASIDVSIFFV